MIQGVHVKLITVLLWQKQYSTRRRLFHQQNGFNLRKKLVKCYIWSITLYGAQNWTHRKADHKYLERFDRLCWRRMETISWTDLVRNEEVLQRAKEERNIK
jgi:hypothetical protein